MIKARVRFDMMKTLKAPGGPAAQLAGRRLAACRDCPHFRADWAEHTPPRRPCGLCPVMESCTWKRLLRGGEHPAGCPAWSAIDDELSDGRMPVDAASGR